MQITPHQLILFNFPDNWMDDHSSNSGMGKNLSLHYCVQNDSGAQPATSSLESGKSFPGSKVAKV